VASREERSLTLAGPGRAGTAFARSWIGAGGRVAQVIARSGGSSQTSRFPGASFRTFDEGSFDTTDLLVLAVPDDRIEGCAARLAGRLSCAFAFHLSGALPADALKPLREAGASVASLHPLRPFTGEEGEDWTDAFIAVEGDTAAVSEGERIARSAEGKPLYHAAASLAAGGTVAVVSVAARACASAGIPEGVAREALAALASRATEAASRSSFEQALTGAVARRDVGTVRAHAQALAPRTEAFHLYRVLADEILTRTPGRGREEEIRAILREAESRVDGDRAAPRNPL
jgi:predicted short-subunit dehydrogenase-like oxidoreductase (DUF2520 family)